MDLPKRDFGLALNGVVNVDWDTYEGKAQMALPIGAGALWHWGTLYKICLQYVVLQLFAQREQVRNVEEFAV